MTERSDSVLAKEKVAKPEFESVVPTLRTALLRAQDDLTDADFPVLVVVDGDDLGGCDGVFERLHQWLDARYLDAHAFGPVEPVDRPYPWMRRYWVHTPSRGRVGIHMRAWTNDVVRSLAFGEIDEAEFERRLEQVRRFERALVDDGVLLLKFWVHLPRKLLKRRLKDALENGDWRVHPEQRIVLKRWEEAIPIAERVLAATNTPETPWQIVLGEDLRARDLAVARHLESALRARLAEERKAGEVESPSVERVEGDPDTVLDSVDLRPSIEDEAEYDRKRKRWSSRLANAHRDACANDIGTVLVFEGWDAGGKGGAVRRLTQAMDATRYRVIPIAAPSEEERAHHWLWRFWRRLPRDGRVAIFDRSWYGRVLVERVEGFATPEAWNRAYAEIEEFEAQLVGHGLIVKKFWMHIDPDEQARRFEARKETAFKRYKITAEDWRNRDRWHDYELAVDEMVERTAGVVPWQIVPANDKWSARIQVLRDVTKAFEGRLRQT